MVLICARVTRINLFLQLSYSCLVVGITTTKRIAESSIPPLLIAENTDLFGGDGVSFDSFDSPSRSSLLEAPIRVNHDYGGSHVEEKVNGVGVQRDDNGNEKYEEAPAADGVIPLDWEGTQARREYLPVDRVAGSYGPSAGIVLANSKTEGGSPLFRTPDRYSSESWNSYWKIRAEFHRDRQPEETKNVGAAAAADRRPGTGKKTTNHRDVPLQDTRPVHEFINDESSSLYELTNDQRNYQSMLQRPKGNRPREQSTDSNTVTLLPAHHLSSEPHGSSISRDTSAATASAFFSIPNWFSTDKGYNSSLHPPPNPVISLILSHYGRYLPGTHQPRIYSYMAVNNIHNNRPFGQYKLTCEEGPTA